MTNKYVINALWAAAKEALEHKDIEALKEIVGAISGEKKSQATETIDIPEKPRNRPSPNPMTVSYRTIMRFIETDNLLEKYVTENNLSTPCFIDIKVFKHWLKDNPDYDDYFRTPNFSDQINSAFSYAATGEFPDSQSFGMVKKIEKGGDRGKYLYIGGNENPFGIVTPITKGLEQSATKPTSREVMDGIVMDFIEQYGCWETFIHQKNIASQSFTESQFRNWLDKNYEDEINELGNRIPSWTNSLIRIFSDHYANPSSENYKGIEYVKLGSNGFSQYQLIPANAAKYAKVYA